jgi:hypothetical protein
VEIALREVTRATEPVAKPTPDLSYLSGGPEPDMWDIRHDPDPDFDIPF